MRLAILDNFERLGSTLAGDAARSLRDAVYAESGIVPGVIKHTSEAGGRTGAGIGQLSRARGLSDRQTEALHSRISERLYDADKYADWSALGQPGYGPDNPTIRGVVWREKDRRDEMSRLFEKISEPEWSQDQSKAIRSLIGNAKISSESDRIQKALEILQGRYNRSTKLTNRLQGIYDNYDRAAIMRGLARRGEISPGSYDDLAIRKFIEKGRGVKQPEYIEEIRKRYKEK